MHYTLYTIQYTLYIIRYTKRVCMSRVSNYVSKVTLCGLITVIMGTVQLLTPHIYGVYSVTTIYKAGLSTV